MQINKRAAVGFASIVCLVLAGCATPDASRGRPVVAPSPPPEPQVQSTPLELGQPVAVRPLPQESMQTPPQFQTPIAEEAPVVLALLDDVEQLQRSGDYEQAAARVERGLRISPKDARLWQRLAIIRLQQHRPDQAESMAQKSNSLARGDLMMQAVNWQIIGDAREMQGDRAGAEQARIRAGQFQ